LGEDNVEQVELNVDTLQTDIILYLIKINFLYSGTGRCDIQHNDTHHYDTHHYDTHHYDTHHYDTHHYDTHH
jgi:hypothetical protein